MNSFISVLYLILGILIFAVIVLAIVYVKITMNDKKKKKEEDAIKIQSSEETKLPSNIKVAKEYTKESIMNFMEFEKVEDSMIIQKENKKFLMAIECQGINYDLMSEVEKASVESGFIKFLNTLRDPIQIYIQTRSINLETSLVGYREKVKDVEMKLNNMRARYSEMRESGEYSAVVRPQIWTSGTACP